MPTVDFGDDKAAFLKALKGGKRGKAAALPSAPRAASTGLSTFILRGWNFEMVVGKGFRLWEWGGRDTGWQVSEKIACDVAKTLM